MSLENFEKAQNHISKFVEIFQYQDECTERLSKNTHIFRKHYNVNSTSVICVFTNLSDTYTVFRRNIFSYPRDMFLHINDSGENWHPVIDRRLRVLEEFDEAWDFQLSTLYTTKQIYEYYQACLLYTAGFRGVMRRFVHINTINAIHWHMKVLSENKDKEPWRTKF